MFLYARVNLFLTVQSAKCKVQLYMRTGSGMVWFSTSVTVSQLCPVCVTTNTMHCWHTLVLAVTAIFGTQLASAQFGGEASNANPFVDTVSSVSK